MFEAGDQKEQRFSTTLPVIVSVRAVGGGLDDWRELDRGPGYFTIPSGQEASVRAKNIDDDDLDVLAHELAACRAVIDLILAENRKVTDEGLPALAALPWLFSLNLSSCSLSNTGMPALEALSGLRRLNLSYCNRITDLGLKSIRNLPNLEYLDLQGCVKITHGGIARLR
ncbi:MAG: leucine-rich repeat domain-containing protein, partial [Anaerolineaceae bacterium]|nr:leucine-rich repeat domain-containing protein [Anaerolineaceae bacterium]